MSLCIAHICGPKGSGKTTLAELLAAYLGSRDLFHLELVHGPDAPPDPVRLTPAARGALLTRRCAYEPDRLFEQLPIFLQSVRRERRWATVLLESDSDPCHRQAHDFAVRLFVAPAPVGEQDVFRPDDAAARALNEVMNDSAAFAAEVYGLPPVPELDELDPVAPPAPFDLAPAGEHVGDRDPLSRSQFGRLLDSDLGMEIAARVQFQPEYQLMLESDVVIINTGCGGAGDVIDTVARRIEELQLCIRRPAGREPLLAVCDLADGEDPMRRSALDRAAELVRAVTAQWPQPSSATTAAPDRLPPPHYRGDYSREAAG